MYTSVVVALLGLAAFAIYKGFSIVVTSYKNGVNARRLGCQDAPAYPNGGFLGIKHVKDLWNADSRQLFPDFLEEREEEMSRLLGRQCSTFSINLLGSKVYYTSDPKNIQAMLATQFQDFCLGPVRHAILSETLGDGIFVQDGKQWESSRAMLRPNFVRAQVSDLDMEERHVRNLLSVVPVENRWTEFFDIQRLFFRLTLDAATEFLFGESVESQLAEAEMGSITNSAGQNQNESAFSTHFDQAQLHMAKKFLLEDMHWLHNPKEYKVNIQVVNDFVKRYVDLALEKGSTVPEKAVEQGHGAKKKYVFLEALAQQTRDPVELRAQLLNILLAGRDTTASLLSWLFHQLLRNPTVFEKLRATIIETFGTFDHPQNITFETLKGCRYLQHTLNETLRIWTLVPWNMRTSTKATTLPRGGGSDGQSPVFLAPDTIVEFAAHVMQRRKDLWGDDADEFKPERFEDRKAAWDQFKGWDFLPFSGGPRICIGQQFALTEAAYVTVRLLQKFDRIEAAPGELNLRVLSDVKMTSRPAGGVTLRLHETDA